MNLNQIQSVAPMNAHAASIVILRKYLAAARELHGEVQLAHRHFHRLGDVAVHELIDTVSKEVETIADMISTRVGNLGESFDNTSYAVSKETYTVPYRLGFTGEKQHVFDVWEALASFSMAIDEAIDQAAALSDPSTADMFLQVMDAINHQLCSVETHLASK